MGEIKALSLYSLSSGKSVHESQTKCENI
uniref:Uncharacterized protein n=1 Tax=Lepeophtheirus salmonis TaxID=72036 RepID=A0A0K2UJX6_LEPSM